MNIICGLSKSLITKNNRVRVIFLKSQINGCEPFMNYMAPVVSQNFVPMGIAFKGKFIENEYREDIVFDIDKEKESMVLDVFLKEVNEMALSYVEIEEKNLHNHWSTDASYGEMNSVEDVWGRVNNSSLYIKSSSKKQNNFITAMVVLESAYQVMLNNCELDNLNKRVEAALSDSEYLKHKDFIQKSNEDIVATHKEKLGETIPVKTQVEILITKERAEKDIQHCIDKFKMKDVDEINELREKICKDIGKIAVRFDMIDTIINEDFINKISIEFKELFSGEREINLIKKATYCPNSDNFILGLQISKIAAFTNFDKSDWAEFVEAYAIEDLMRWAGLEFLPSRRMYLGESIENKQLFKDLSELKESH